MKFIAITLIVHEPNATGAQKSTHARFREVIDNALLAEELGFDGFGVGERHERPICLAAFVRGLAKLRLPTIECSCL